MVRFHIFVGHFGSGKSELAVNFAIKCAEGGEKVSIVDLDIVNPYFRTNDARKVLEGHGIEVIAPEFANSNLDMPTVPGDIMKVFNNPERVVIFDVGGDEDGAYALGRYIEHFKKEDYKMHLVVNQKRPLTETAEEITDMAREIERASRLKVTDIINNTNIGAMTDRDTILSGLPEVNKAAEILGVDISMVGVKCDNNIILPKELEDKVFKIDIKIKMPWEK